MHPEKWQNSEINNGRWALRLKHLRCITFWIMDGNLNSTPNPSRHAFVPHTKLLSRALIGLWISFRRVYCLLSSLISKSFKKGKEIYIKKYRVSRKMSKLREHMRDRWIFSFFIRGRNTFEKCYSNLATSIAIILIIPIKFIFIIAWDLFYATKIERGKIRRMFIRWIGRRNGTREKYTE